MDVFLQGTELLLSLPNLCVQLSESDFKGLVVTDDSSIVLNQLHEDEQGTYRCSVQSQKGTVFYRVTFLLTGREKLLSVSSNEISHVREGELMEYFEQSYTDEQ